MSDRGQWAFARLLVPLVVIPLVVMTACGYLVWRASEWAAERAVEQQLGDKLEIAVDVVRQLARERVAATDRIAAGGEPAAGDLVLIRTPASAAQIVRAADGIDASALEPVLATLTPDAADIERRFALVPSGETFLAVASTAMTSGRALVTGRRLPADVLERFTSVAGTEMGLFADWQRARASSFAIDLRECRECHGDDWRVRDVGDRFHAGRSFNGRGFFSVARGDGFRYAFTPLELGGRRMAMLVVRQPLAALVSARQQSLAVVSGGGVLAIGLSIGVWWMVSRRLTSTLVVAQRWIESIAVGPSTPDARVEVHGAVARLARSLGPSVSALRDSHDQLSRMNAELDCLVGTQSTTIATMQERLGTFLELGRAPETVPDADDVACNMLRHIGQLCGYAWGRLILADPDVDGRLQCVALDAANTRCVPYDDGLDSLLMSAARRCPTAFHLDASLGPRSARGPVLVVPILLRGQTLGALALADRTRPSEPEPDASTLDALVRQGALALEHSVLYRRAQEAYLHTASVLVTTIEGKDAYLRGHSERVARMTVATAEALGIDAGERRALEQVARLHDVGKICIDSTILLKPGRLTEAEYDAVKRHVEIGEAIVSQIDSLRPWASVVGQHHERFDGRGYVRGLGGGDITLEARIVAVCDAFDAMTSLRPYRPPRAFADAAAEIQADGGRQFDPRVASVFVDLVGAGLLPIAAVPA